MILTHESVRHVEDGNVKKKQKIKKVAKGLEEKSKTHAKQAKMVKKHIKEMKKMADQKR